MKKGYKILLYAIVCFVHLTVNTAIHKVSSIEEITCILAGVEFDDESLVIFDVDSTLIYYDKKDVVHLVEPETAQFVKVLQMHAKTIAFTSSYVGKNGHRNLLFEDKRRDDLLKLHIDFAKQWADNYIFYDLEKSYNSQTQVPLFKYGILFTGAFYDSRSKKIPAHSKGILLSHFLYNARLHPLHIFMIDNNLSNLKSAEKIARKLAIPFDGFWYGRIRFTSSIVKSHM
jgi:hypothetical protein